MEEHINYLYKRRQIMMAVVIVLALIALIVSLNFSITPSNYFNGVYNYSFIGFLFVYKIIELTILYYLLLHRHAKYIKHNPLTDELLQKIKKHTKLLLFLIPQGNTVFGIISYKLSGDVKYFLFFSLIALITLILVNPNKLSL